MELLAQQFSQESALPVIECFKAWVQLGALLRDDVPLDAAQTLITQVFELLKGEYIPVSYQTHEASLPHRFWPLEFVHQVNLWCLNDNSSDTHTVFKTAYNTFEHIDIIPGRFVLCSFKL